MNDDYFKALGKVVFYFACLELQYKQMFFAISYIDKFTGMTFISEINFSHFLKIIKKVLKNKYKEYPLILSRVELIVTKSLDANKKRNDILHSYWLIDGLDSEKTLYKYKMKGELENVFDKEIKKISVNDIESVAKEIKLVFYDVADLFFDIKTNFTQVNQS